MARARSGQQGLGLVREEAPPLQRTLTRRCPAALAADAGESGVARGRASEEKRRDVHSGLVAPPGAWFSVGELDSRPWSGCVRRVRCSWEVSQPATCLPSVMHPLGYRLQSPDGVRVRCCGPGAADHVTAPHGWLTRLRTAPSGKGSPWSGRVAAGMPFR